MLQMTLRPIVCTLLAGVKADIDDTAARFPLILPTRSMQSSITVWMGYMSDGTLVYEWVCEIAEEMLSSGSWIIDSLCQFNDAASEPLLQRFAACVCSLDLALVNWKSLLVIQSKLRLPCPKNALIQSFVPTRRKTSRSCTQDIVPMTCVVCLWMLLKCTFR